jgi:hypothetical protein
MTEGICSCKASRRRQVVTLVVGRRRHQFEVESTVEDVVEHAEEIAFLE